MSPLDPLLPGSIRTPSGLPQPQQQGQGVRRGGAGAPLPDIPEGSLVKGVVLSAEKGGTYLVKVLGQQLRAMANLRLMPGQHFQAFWETSKGMPTLRLVPSDLSLLRSIPLREHPLALALLSRGLSLSDEVLASLRSAWSRLGGEQTPGALAELWARGLPLSGENVQLLLWYTNLPEQRVLQYWKRIRENLRRLGRQGKLSSLRAENMAGDDEELARFLKAHIMLSTPARDGVDPSLLLPVRWPLGENSSSSARVVLKKEKRGERNFWRVHFSMEGSSLGTVQGHLASDERALVVSLGAEDRKALHALWDCQEELAEELSKLALPLASLSMSLSEDESQVSYRAIDMEA